MNEQEDLIQLAEEKLTYAKVLLENEGYADSISRSYYGMFNAAKAILKTEGSSPKTHQGVNSELGKLFRNRIDRKLLRQFSKIQDRREDVDYTNTEVTKEEAEEILEAAQEFVKKAKEITERTD